MTEPQPALDLNEITRRLYEVIDNPISCASQWPEVSRKLRALIELAEAQAPRGGSDGVAEIIAALRSPSHEQDAKWHDGKTPYATKPRKLLDAAADALAAHRPSPEASRSEAVERIARYLNQHLFAERDRGELDQRGHERVSKALMDAGEVYDIAASPSPEAEREGGSLAAANTALRWIFRNGFRHSSECPADVNTAFNDAFAIERGDAALKPPAPKRETDFGPGARAGWGMAHMNEYALPPECEEPCPKRGDIQIVEDRVLRFIEREIEGDKWEVLGTVSPSSGISREEIALGEPCTLAECPVGLFLADAYGTLGMKTEYGSNEGAIDAYIVESGETFCGDHPQTIERQRAQIVRPISHDAILAKLRGDAE